MEIAEYKIIELIYQSPKAKVFLAEESNTNKVVLKIFEQNTEEGILPDNEYTLLENLSLTQVAKVKKIGIFENKHYLVREYLEGLTMRKFLDNNILKLPDFLSLTIQLSNILIDIHEKGIIHKDFNNNNIIINPKTLEASLIDFGISSQIDLKTQNLGNPQRLEGTLAYISPEQTGRMNRIVDYRTDLYSFGVVLYEMLTNELPFKYEDPLEVVHAHIALQPTSPEKLRKDVPRKLSEIILKLLAKNAEDRYQSAYGCKVDLEKVRQAYKENRPVEDFRLGLQDFSIKFQIPQKLYGREKESQRMIEAFQMVSQKAKKLMKVSGYSGTGKSALIAEVHKPITALKGYFIEGKFDQFQKNIPFFAWQQAFNKLTDLLLTETDEQIAVWKNRILEKVGTSGAAVLTELNPNLSLIIGKQPSPEELDATETQNRFYATIKNFVKAIAQKEHPIAIFIDDWQWADLPSIQLLKNICLDNDTNYLLIITAYRNNEVSETHPFQVALKEIEEDLSNPHFDIEEIEVKNLSQEHISEIVQDTLRRKDEAIQGLTEVVIKKTEGNAFFVIQFLKSLYEEKLIQLKAHTNPQEGYQWTFDLPTIQQVEVTENVVELMTRKIKKLPANTQNALRLAACIGAYFDLKMLASVQETNLKDTYHPLLAAMQEGLIVPTDGAKRMHTNFRFAHDRIQQACYSLLAEEEKQPTHYQIAQALYSKTTPQELELKIFEIVNQYNSGASLIKNQEEKYLVAELNLMATQKAKDSAAYQPALVYVEMAIGLLPTQSWEEKYALTLALHKEWLEIAYFTGNTEASEHILQKTLTKVTDVIDRTQVLEIQIHILKAQSRWAEVLELGKTILKDLGVKLPKNPTTFHILAELIPTKMMMSRKKMKSVLNNPSLTDPKLIAVERILSNISSASYFSNPTFLPLIICQQTKIAAKIGHSTYSAYSYVSFALMLSGVFSDIEGAYELALTAEKVMAKYPNKKLEGRINFVTNICAYHWKTPHYQCVKNFREGYQKSVEVGDYEYAGLNAGGVIGHSFYAGRSLAEIIKLFIGYEKAFRVEYKDIARYYGMYASAAPLIHLTQTEKEFKMFDGTPYSQNLLEKHYIEKKDLTSLGIINQTKIVVNYLMGEYEKVLEHYDQLIEQKNSLAGSAVFTIGQYYYGISLLKLAQEQPDKKDFYLRKFKKEEKKLRFYYQHGEINYAHKYALLEAEKYALLKNYQKAALHYGEAIDKAKQIGCMHDEAKAYESAALFYEKYQQKDLHLFYLQNAYNTYQKWGASLKTQQLIKKYPEHIKQEKYETPIYETFKTISSTITTSDLPRTSSSSKNFKSFDALSLIKSLQVLSGEILMQNLLEKMMQFVVENAGAQRGVLILDDNNKMLVQGEIDFNSQKKIFLQATPIEQYQQIPANILNYVIRSQEYVVIADATLDERLTQNEYIQNYKPQSLLFVPLVKQGKLKGLLYLENNLTTGAFTSDRVEILKLMSAQIAISIENAALYENLEDKVKERTTEVMHQKELIEKQKIDIEEKSYNITASINYARRIQRAILPTPEAIRQSFQEHFIFYAPRDIVSGDFYWLHQKENKTLFAVIDCTGHGVPGAFMTVIANSQMNRIVQDLQIETPHEILNELHLSIRKILKQDENQNRDGMDMSLIMIENNTLYFSAARNPLILIQEGEMQIVKGDKMSIGGEQREQQRSFTLHSFPLKPKGQNTIYLFSDGYQDQIGGSETRKFLSRNLHQLLFSIHQKSIDEQHEIVANTIEQWMKQSQQEQLDDILVMGIRI